MCLVGFVAVLMVMVISSGTVLFPPLVENPELHDLMDLDKSAWITRNSLLDDKSLTSPQSTKNEHFNKRHPPTPRSALAG